MRKTFLIIYLLLNNPITLFSQEINIVDYLKRIESGEIDNVRKELPALLSENRNDPSIKFLDAVLTVDGNEAVTKYEHVYNNYPNSKYADAALYRIFSFYYSLGIYNKAETYLNELKKKYPSSPYLNAADRKIPDEENSIVESFETLSKIAKSSTQQNNQTKYNFTVQAGAFLNFENADKLKDDLIKAGYPSEVNAKTVGGTILNVVTVGKFISEKEADPVLNLLKQNFKLSGRVISITN